MYFLDTNICIFFLNGSNKHVKQRLLATPPNKTGIPAPVKAELIFGAFKSRNRNENIKKVEEFLQPFEIIPFDDSVTFTYADIRYKCEAKGTPVGPNDLFIAAIALHNGAALVSANVKEFSTIDGLMVENWTAPVD
ncbi:MAG: type II toxin-antitoxin system VapC family toxin [Spirochaetales bacterium]|nr:type II toxin-antitoxin system VapC family toxin [Spirochaetales bacterium]MCF7938781.1 type II toxin-antitoxin system VapC family toxin [Spirochaetales bacterium]